MLWDIPDSCAVKGMDPGMVLAMEETFNVNRYLFAIGTWIYREHHATCIGYPQLQPLELLYVLGWARDLGMRLLN